MFTCWWIHVVDSSDIGDICKISKLLFFLNWQNSIGRIQTLEYPIFGVLTPGWAPRVIWNCKLNTPVLIITEKVYSDYNMILLSPSSPHPSRQFLWRFLKKVWNNSLCYILALNPVCPTYITVPLILKGLTDRHI